MKWSVIIPVYRPTYEVLERAVTAWGEVGPDEIVFCCDGPDPRVQEVVGGRGIVIQQEHRGQSAATNRAARVATGEMLLFSAQDIIPHPRIIVEHERVHRQRPGNVVLGYIPWHPDLTVTPFMDFLVHGGPQFAFDTFVDGAEIPPYYLYAPNFSIARERFPGFRDDLPYGCQDSELGLRLAQEGMKLLYNASAIGYHWHPQQLRSYLERQYRAGQAMVTLARLHPYHVSIAWLEQRVRECFEPFRFRIDDLVAEALRRETEGDSAALRVLYDRITRFHFYRGVYETLRESPPQPTGG